MNFPKDYLRFYSKMSKKKKAKLNIKNIEKEIEAMAIRMYFLAGEINRIEQEKREVKVYY